MALRVGMLGVLVIMYSRKAWEDQIGSLVIPSLSVELQPCNCLDRFLPAQNSVNLSIHIAFFLPGLELQISYTPLTKLSP